MPKPLTPKSPNEEATDTDPMDPMAETGYGEVTPSPYAASAVANKTPKAEEEPDDDDEGVFDETMAPGAEDLVDAPTGISTGGARRSSPKIKTSLPTTEDKGPTYIGKLLGQRFLIKSKLGQGGMGAVFRAEDQRTQQDVAVKLLPMQMSTDEGVLQRFKRESRVQLSLEHPNIVRTISAGQEDELGCFLAMELLNGEDMKDFTKRVGRRKLTPPEIVLLYRQLCEALDYTHRRGIVHRDLKPANIFLREHPDGDLHDVCLIDFGIAKLNSDDVAQLTVTGMFLGTPSYMSPEQAAGQTGIDSRSDIYSIGIMLYESLVGLPPFFGDNMVKILMDHLYNQPPPLTQIRPEMHFPPALQKLLDRMLSKERDKRPGAIMEVAKELQQILAGLEAFEETGEAVDTNTETQQRDAQKIATTAKSVREQADRLLEGLQQPAMPSGLYPMEELYAQAARQLRHCEAPPIKVSELMMEMLLEDFSSSDEAEPDIDEPPQSDILPTGEGVSPQSQTIGRMQLSTIEAPREQSRFRTSSATLPTVEPSPKGKKAGEEILSLDELEKRLGFSAVTKEQDVTYQRRQPQFTKVTQGGGGSRALLWLLLFAVAALAAIGLYLLQRGNPSEDAESRVPTPHMRFADHTPNPPTQKALRPSSSAPGAHKGGRHGC